ncbi:MAG: NAD(P)-binding protein [Parasphingorhabdus sp.]
MALDNGNTKPTLAVIGTGIAGLTSAFLAKSKFDVTVYESHARAGMGAHVVDYVSNGIESRIDIPLRIFSPGYYQNLTALYKHIGVRMLTSDHAGAFVDEKGDIILHYGNTAWGPLHFSYLKGRSMFSRRAWKIAMQSRLFFARAKRDVKSLNSLSTMTFEQYLDQTKPGKEFVETSLLPLLSVTCTCDYQSVKRYPADIMLEYLTCGVHTLGITSAANGVDDIVPRLLKGVTLRTNSTVGRITKNNGKLNVATSDGHEQSYDQVIVATQAQQAASLLSGFQNRHDALNQIPIEKSIMSVHTDSDLLPKTDAELSPVTYYVPKQTRRSEVSVDLTKAIARLSGQNSVFQTWNPLRKIAANKELARVEFTRPAVTLDSRAAVAKLHDQNQASDNQLWLCGSYMTNKIPLLEAAVDSAISVAEGLGIQIPWQTQILPD